MVPRFLTRQLRHSCTSNNSIALEQFLKGRDNLISRGGVLEDSCNERALVDDAV